MPSYAQYADALDRLEAMSASPFGQELCGVDAFGPRLREDTRARTATHPGCGAGTTVCSISAEGRVNPCSFLGPELDAGNLRERVFRDIWDSSHEFRALRDPENDRSEEENDTSDGGFDGGCRRHGGCRSGQHGKPC